MVKGPSDKKLVYQEQWNLTQQAVNLIHQEQIDINNNENEMGNRMKW